METIYVLVYVRYEYYQHKYNKFATKDYSKVMVEALRLKGETDAKIVDGDIDEILKNETRGDFYWIQELNN